jgi:hypothetical protein
MQPSDAGLTLKNQGEMVIRTLDFIKRDARFLGKSSKQYVSASSLIFANKSTL